VKPYRLICLCAILWLVSCDRGDKPLWVGKTAPGFTVHDEDHKVSLADYRGKVVVLNFWGTWCPPCVQEMPSLVAMQKQLQGQVTVLAVSIDHDPKAYHKFITERGIVPTLVTVRDNDQASSTLYGTFGWPETYVIDRGGVVRRKFIGAVDWTSPEIIEYLTKL
jgi:cytochrome c biogenesis protein CcmG/thiol:disulfide interchange protein DsbE